MFDLIFSLVTFIVIYLAYIVFVINRKEKLQKFKKSMMVQYLVIKYKIDIKKIDIKVLAHLIALTTSFILSATLFVISFIDNYILKIVLSFVIIIPFQYIMLMIIGKMYQKSGQTKLK
jgi:hypothetical protein